MSQPIHYCSYFDHRYLARALCLYDSLREHSPTFVWHVLALSEQCEQMLQHLNLPCVQVTSLGELEAANPELHTAKNNRSIVEYYFTLTSAFCRHLIDDCPADSLLNYLDSDLYFFSSPEPVFRELEESSIGIIEHRFSQANLELVRYGRFNVGWVSFRNDSRGLQCLNDWYSNCLKWCYDRVEGERFADQKYLDAWPHKFPGVRVIGHRGANVGPWNIVDFQLQPEKHEAGSPATNNPTPLVFCHFQNVRHLGHRTYSTAFDEYKIDTHRRKQISRQIYRPYLCRLYQKEQSILAMLGPKGRSLEAELREARSMLMSDSLRELLILPLKYARMISRYSWITV